MRYMTGLLLFVLPLLFADLTATAAEASTVDNVAMLAQNGLGEEALLAYVARTDGAPALSTDQIVRLKEAGVPEKVIVAMLRKQTMPTGEPEARVIVRQPQVIREVEPQTTVVYQPSYVSSYPSYSYPYSSAYYPSSYYYPSSSCYPSSYYSRYSSPFTFSLGFGSYGSWGGRGSYYGGSSHHGGGGHRR